MASSNSSIMSTIDSLKDKMSDEVYLELCNKMKELHNQKEDEAKPYCIWYMVAKGRTIMLSEIVDGNRYDVEGWRYPVDEIGRGTTELYRYDISPQKQVVVMTQSEADKIKNDIDNSDNHCGEFSFNTKTMAPFYKKYRIGKYEKDLDNMTVDVYRIEPM